MTFNSEAEFENHIRSIIRDEIIYQDENLILINGKKAVDIMVCRNGAEPSVQFIEIKYHKKSIVG